MARRIIFRFFKYYVLDNHPLVMASAVSRVMILRVFSSLGVKDAALQTAYLPLIGFASDLRVFQAIKKSWGLDDRVLAFCAGKDAGMAHLRRLPSYGADLLVGLLGLSESIQLTLGLFFELADLIHDEIQRSGDGFTILSKRDAVVAILAESGLSTRNRADALKQYFTALKLPTLTRINTDLDEVAADFGLRGVGVRWDRSLEAKSLALRFEVTSVEELSERASWLAGDAASKLTRDLLAAF